MIVPTAESYLGTMQKHQELIFSSYPQQLMLCTYPGPQYFFNFWHVDPWGNCLKTVLQTFIAL